ncbi:MAG: hypothetical protein JW976_14460 [Syntrophaceae bacterium]|nr:hypothetical protein [Syntrophaceae bacterium]
MVERSRIRLDVPIKGEVILGSIDSEKFIRMPKLIDIVEEPLLMEKSIVYHPRDQKTKDKKSANARRSGCSC